MKKNLLSILMLLAILFATSCSSDDDDPIIEKPLLEVSELEVTLTNSSSEEQITITTNQDKWVATSPAEGNWLMLEKQGDKLIVKGMENLKGEERTSYILINAGTLAEKIMVKQSAADIVLEASPGEINVPNTGGSYLVDITSNTTNWTIEKEDADADWVMIKPFAGADIAELTVLPNETTESRTLKLFAKSGAKIEEVIINQAGGGGEGSLKFILPLLERAPTQFEILQYEEQNGSYLLSYSGALPSWGIFDETYDFALNSSVFYSTVYDRNVKTGMMTNITLWSERNAADIVSEEFKELLEANGFEVTLSETGLNGKNTEKKFLVKAIVDLEADLGRVDFTPYVEQDKDYPTFDEFPYDRVPWLDNKEFPLDVIRQTELDEGATIDIDEPNGDGRVLSVLLAEKYLPKYQRLYFIDKDNLATQFITIWNDVNLGAWTPDEGISYKLTKEFIALMEGEGFEFILENNGDLFYYRESDNLVLLPRGAKFSDVMDGEPVFAINYWHEVVDMSSMKLDKDSYNKFTEKLIKKTRELDAKLDIIK